MRRKKQKQKKVMLSLIVMQMPLAFRDDFRPSEAAVVAGRRQLIYTSHGETPDFRCMDRRTRSAYLSAAGTDALRTRAVSVAGFAAAYELCQYRALLSLVWQSWSESNTWQLRVC